MKTLTLIAVLCFTAQIVTQSPLQKVNLAYENAEMEKEEA
jgi:hypothetical protein